MDKRIKCSACKRVKFEEDFLKNQKLLKTCITCREKQCKKGLKESKEETKEIIKVIKETSEIIKEVTKEIIEETKEVSIEETIEVIKETRWVGLSGYWIQPGDEPKLHKKLLRKVNRQFLQHSAFPVHKYLSRWWMVDIRDMHSASE